MTMLGKLPFFWLIMSISTVAVVSYFISLMIDGVFGKDGFGTIGNMVVLTAGFFGGLVVAEKVRFAVHGLQQATFVGLGGALTTFLVLALLRLILDKIR
jgi:hypothetical protein